MSDTNPHIRHHLHMSHGKRVEVVYRDHRRDSDTAGRAGGGAASGPQQAPQTPQAQTPQAKTSQAQTPQAQTSAQAQAPARAQTAQTSCAPQELHVCFNCSSQLVYPLDWTEEGPRHWRIVLRCPECEARREGVFEQEIVEQLDDELDRASGALLSDLKRLTHANMSDEVEFFVRALRADLIVPSDFQ